MPSRDLHDLVELLECRGELLRIPVQVDSRHELALITRRVASFSGGGPALLFEKVDVSPIPVLTNLFGSPERVASILEIHGTDGLCDLMLRFLTHGGPEPQHVSDPACQEVVAGLPACDNLPIPVAWPDDGRPTHGGRFITLGQVITRAFGEPDQNIGVYRVACCTGTELGVSWQKGSGGAAHHAAWSTAGQQMPVAIVLGGDPAVMLAAMTPIPQELDELAFAGAIRGNPVLVCRALTSDLVIPAGGEIVIEGLVDPVETRNEGAFGNYSGGYAGGGQVPLVRVTAVTSRRNPIFPALIAGPPPCENLHIAAAISRFMEPLVRQNKVVVPPWTSLFNKEGIPPVPLQKLAWPQGLEELVDRRWQEYGFSNGK